MTPLTDRQRVRDWFIANAPWWPQEGPQEAAWLSEADVLLYGGAAGGGKTSLAVALACMRHVNTLFIRKEGTQLGGVRDEVAKMIDPDRNGYSGKYNEWKIPPWDGVKRKIVFGSIPNPGDETKHQGRERCLLVIDEAANNREDQIKFLMGWTRSDDPRQRCRTLMCSNPPTSSEGLWLIEMFAPWLDPQYPNPAMPGELRYFANIDEQHTEVDRDFIEVINGVEVGPQSYTFIPAKVTDNKYLGVEYMRVLNAMPEPLRSQMLHGDFTAGQEDDEYQVIPTIWIKEAQARWTEKPRENITSCGIDPSRGGKDATVLTMRSGWHFHALQRWKGEETNTGGKVANKVISAVGHMMCPVHVDVIGIGASVIDHLEAVINTRAVPIDNRNTSKEQDWTGVLNFANKRAEDWWRLRDILNPENGQNVSLPPDKRLLADLTAPRYKLMGNGIQIESKDDIKKRIGRSPDDGDSVALCANSTSVMHISGYTAPRIQVKGSIR